MTEEAQSLDTSLRRQLDTAHAGLRYVNTLFWTSTVTFQWRHFRVKVGGKAILWGSGGMPNGKMFQKRNPNDAFS